LKVAARRNTLLVQLLPHPNMQRGALLGDMPERINPSNTDLNPVCHLLAFL
jgi:hypothetical protein